MSQDIAKNLKSLQEKIQGLSPLKTIHVVAVSKNQPETKIREAFAIGQVDFAENYAQEFVQKSKTLSDLPLRWHFIGYLQSNKLKYIVGNVALVHTLDRLRLAEEMQKICVQKNGRQPCLIQVKISDKDEKTGCPYPEVIEFAKGLASFSHLDIRGLMAIGSLTSDPQTSFDEYSRIRDLQTEINQKEIFANPLTELSMGMSADYPQAIKAGATIVRIGTQIFGERAISLSKEFGG